MLYVVEGNRRSEGLVMISKELSSAEMPCSRAREMRRPWGDTALNKEILENVDHCRRIHAIPGHNSERPYCEIESVVTGSSVLISYRESLRTVIRALELELELTLPSILMTMHFFPFLQYASLPVRPQ